MSAPAALLATALLGTTLVMIDDRVDAMGGTVLLVTMTPEVLLVVVNVDGSDGEMKYDVDDEIQPRSNEIVVSLSSAAPATAANVSRDGAATVMPERVLVIVLE